VKNNPEHKGPFSLGELGPLLGAEVRGDPNLQVSGIEALENAAPGQLSFLFDSRYLHLVSKCRASALIVSPKFKDLNWNLLIAGNPQLVLARAIRLFLPESRGPAGIHPSAFIGEGVSLGKNVSVGPFAHAGDNSRIGDDTDIGSGVYLGKDVRIGGQCTIHPRVCILDGCVIGDRVIIHAGAVIGADGYGYAPDEKGAHVKICHTGIVQIDDDVEIGANTTIDRAVFGKTWIKRGVKIDNLVMIAHNVMVGEDTLLVAQVGISGSTRVGKQVVMAGQVGVAGHLQIGDRARVGAKTGIHHSIKANHDVAGGLPGMPHDEWLRAYANIQRLPRLKEALKRLEERVRQIEEAMKKDDEHRSD
jgi:UDP-3-O-[3-hydroxymyristoyl] glucosamine N-acyltransferase